MIDYKDLTGKRVKIITMIIFKSGRKINIQYIGIMNSHNMFDVNITEIDGTKVRISKKHIKRIEEIQ